MTTSMASSSLDDVAARHPEWHAWLALYRDARRACDDSAWADDVASAHDPAAPPFLTGSRITVAPARVRDIVQRLLQRAFTVKRRAITREVAMRVIEAAVNMDDDALADVAGALGVGAELFREVAGLAAMPVLQACGRRWAERIPADWIDAACPICGAWAALAEARGLERSLRLRCGRCGADWAAVAVRCPFCGTADHEKLGALVSEREGDTRRVEACTVCLGYMKTVTTLRACAPADVRLLDTDTVELDVAALEHGYARPRRPARALGARLVAPPRGRLGAFFRGSR
jgi:FdhE protein